MAQLRAVDGGASLPIPAHCLVGRSGACSLRLTAADVSNEHASLSWLEQRWELRDLGSRNGTFVNGAGLSPGKAVPLRREMTVRFGTTGPTWRVVDDGPPLLAALELETGTWLTSEHRILGLPNDDAPTVSVLHGADAGWHLQTVNETRAVRDGEIISVGRERWRVHLPDELLATAQSSAPSLAQPVSPRFIFAVSRDEEQVELLVTSPSAEPRSLGIRAHHYLLLVLARIRKRDGAEDGLMPSEQGWVHLDQLTKMLCVDRSHLHVTIYRARRHLAQAGIANANAAVELRARASMARFGFQDFAIQPL
jgi:FHA domain